MSHPQQAKERRLHTRVFFSIADEVCGAMTFPGITTGPVRARINDLSLGGLFFSLDRTARLAPPAEGETAILTEITTALDFHMHTRCSLTIKRIQDLAILEVIGFGCEFSHIPPGDLEKLAGFIDRATKSERSRNGS